MVFWGNSNSIFCSFRVSSFQMLKQKEFICQIMTIHLTRMTFRNHCFFKILSFIRNDMRPPRDNLHLQLITRDFKKTTTATAMRSLQKKKDLISRTIAKNVRFKYLYIS